MKRSSFLLLAAVATLLGTSPARAQDQGDTLLPVNPFGAAQPGDWEGVSIQVPDLGVSEDNFVKVDSSDLDQVVIAKGSDDQGWVRRAFARAFPPSVRAYLELDGTRLEDVAVADEAVNVKGRRFSCKKISARVTGEDDGEPHLHAQVAAWVSSEVKGYGLVAMDVEFLGIRARLEVVGFGAKDQVEWGKHPEDPRDEATLLAHERNVERFDASHVRLFHHEHAPAAVVKVPTEALEAILRRYPNGALLRTDDFRALLQHAGLARLSDLDKPRVESAPVSWAIEGASVLGSLQGEVATFKAVVTVNVLEKKAVAVPLLRPSFAGIREITVDGQPARLARVAEGYAVLLEGPGEKQVQWTFTVALEKGEEKGAGGFQIPLLPGSVATHVGLDLPGDLEVLSGNAPITVSSSGKTTHVEAAAGGREAIAIVFHPKNPETPAVPYVTVEDASRFLMRRGLCQLDLVSVFSTWRAGRDRFSIDLPHGFVVRSLETVPAGATWVQRDDRVELSFARERTGDTGVRLRAELVTPQDGPVALASAQYPGAARHSGLLGVARGEDMHVAVTKAQALERADLDELPTSSATGLQRVYRHGSPASALEVVVRPLEPRVDLQLTAVEDIRERELKLLAVYRYRVLEGTVFVVRAELPESWRLDRVEVRDGFGRPLKHEIKTETVPAVTGTAGRHEPRTAQVIALEGGVREGQEVVFSVRAAREVPAGIATEGSLPIPELTGTPATTTGGYLAFQVEPAFRLRGDVNGLLPFPVEALARVGLEAPGAALGFRIESAQFQGSLALKKKETRVAAKTLVFHQIDERTVGTDAVFDFDITGAPVDRLELLIPKDASQLVRIEGEDVAEHSPAGAAPDGRERRLVRFQSPKLGAVRLLVHFDTQVAGFQKAEGAEKTTLELPRVSAGDGCERERGTIAVFSGDATELRALAENLHPVDVTEVGEHPRVKPQGRPLFAYSYAGASWKLGLEVERHEAAYVLSAVVERATVRSTIGRDGVGRHTAEFSLKNLSHQYFTLQMPESSQIWSVLVNGQGVKPAEDGGAKIVPIPPGTSPDRPLLVTVSYEVRSSEMGRLGKGQLVAPVLLQSKGGEPVPVLRTAWSLSLPDEFKYVEFSGNVEGARAFENDPLVVQAWHTDRDGLIQLALFVALGLAVAASERARAVAIGAGVGVVQGIAGLLKAILAGLGGLLSSARTARPPILIAGGVALAALMTCLFIPNLARDRGAMHLAKSAPAMPQGALRDESEVDRASVEGRGGAPARRERSLLNAPGKAGAPPPAAAPEPMPMEPMLEAEEAKKEEAPAKKKAAFGRAMKDAKVSGADKALAEDDEAPAEKPAAPPAPALAQAQNAPAQTRSALGPSGGKGAEGESNVVATLTPETGRTPPPQPKKPAARAQASAFGEKGLRSLVLALPPVGSTRGFERDGGEAVLAFRYVRSDVWSWALVLCAAAGFALGVFLPRREQGPSYLGLLLVACVVLSALPYLVVPALTGGPCNALLAGLLLAAPVNAFVAIERARRDAAERRRKLAAIKVPSKVVALLVLGLALFGSTGEARAQDKPAGPAPDRRVFVPYDPEHPEKPSDKVFVPADLYEELWKRAHPEAHAAARPIPPASFATSGVSYEGTLSSKGLELTARVKVEILQEGWVEAPLGLDGASILKVTPDTARLQPQANGGFALVAKGPATFDLTLELLVPREGNVWQLGTLRSAAGLVKLTTHEKGMAVKVVRDFGSAQTEEALADGGCQVEANLGADARVRIVYGARETVAVGGASEASARSTTLYTVRRGRVEVLSSFEFEVSGEGREAFRFALPEGVEITAVETEALRSWHVATEGGARFLDVALKRPSGSRATVVVRGERATAKNTLELPEIAARAVNRDEGSFGISVEPGLRVSFGKSPAALRQVDPSELAGAAQRAGAPSPERAYAFTKRPAGIGLEMVEDALELKGTSRVLGVVRGDRYEVTAWVEFVAKHGRTYELEVIAPAELELVGEPEGALVRERRESVELAARRLTFGLAKALVAPATATLKLTFARRLARGEVSVALPDVRAQNVTGEDGELVLCSTEGLRLRAEGEAERFQTADPDPIARRLGVPADAKPSFAWTRRPKSPTSLSTQRAAIEHPPAHVEGTAVTLVTIERDVVRTTVRVLYEVSEAGVRVFSFTRPARFGERIAVHAPNQRELRSLDLPTNDPKDARRRFEVELESAVQGLYEMTLEWEEPLPASQQVDVARLDLEGLSRARGWVLVFPDPSVTEKVELSKERTSGVASVPADQCYALPPGKDARDFGDRSFRVEGEGWKLGFDLKAVQVQEPAPARIETARIDTVVHEDGSLLNRATYRVRNRTLQFLAVRLPKGAEVWTVHVAGEPKRIHTLQELTLVPLPKRADADLSFEVEVVFRTRLEGSLGVGSKISPVAPVLETKGVEVERTFWTLYLPRQYDELARETGLDETDAAVSQAQDVRAQVQELALLNDIATRSKGQSGEIAYGNLEANYKRVLSSWSSANDQIQRAAQSSVNAPAKGKGQALVNENAQELQKLQRVLTEIGQQQDQRRSKRAQGQGPVIIDGIQESRNPIPPTSNAAPVPQSGVTMSQSATGGAVFRQHALQDWKLNDATFKQRRGTSWEGIEQQKEGQSAPEGQKITLDAAGDLDRAGLTYLDASKQPNAPVRVGQKGVQNEGKNAFHLGRNGQIQQQAQGQRGGGGGGQGAFAFDDDDADGRDATDKLGAKTEAPRNRKRDEEERRKRPELEKLNALKQVETKPQAKPNDAQDGKPQDPDAPKIFFPGAEESDHNESNDGEDYGQMKGDSKEGLSYVPGTEGGVGGRRANKHANGIDPLVDRPMDKPDFQAQKPPRAGELNGRYDTYRPSEGLTKSVEQAEAKRALLSIGFEFQLPQDATAIHLTTTNATREGMALSLRVGPRSAGETAGRVLRGLVLALLVLSVARLGLLRSMPGKGAAQALALLVAGGLAGAAILSSAGAALAAVVAVVGLARSRRSA